MKRVLIFSDFHYNSFSGGGITASLRNMIDFLKKDFRFKNYFTESEKDNWLRLRFNFLIKFFTLLFVKKFDIIIINGFFFFYSSIIPILFSRLLKVDKIVIFSRGMLKDSALNKNYFLKVFTLFLIKLISSKKCIIQATDQKEYYEISKFFNLKILIASDFPPKHNLLIYKKKKKINHLNLLYVGRIDDLKNLKLVLKILIEFQNKFQNKYTINFNIIGNIADQNYWNECKSHIKKLNKSYNIIYLGFIDNKKLYNYFNLNHLYISLTKGENFGYTIAESLSNNLPIIISDKTIFKNLESQGLGFEIDISKNSKIFSVLKFFLDMNNVEYQKYIVNLHNKIENYYQFEEIEKSHIKLFEV